MNNIQICNISFVKIASDQDNGQVGMAKHLATGAGAYFGTGFGSDLLSRGYLSAAGDLTHDGSKSHKDVIKSISRLLSRNNTTISHDKLNVSALGQNMSKPIKGPLDAAYNSFTNTVGVSRDAHPGIFAHEAGHAKGTQNFMWSNILGKNLGSLASLYALFGTRDKSTADTAAMVSGGLMAAGTLPSEIDASRLGFSMLRKLPFKDRIKSFVGLPTYLLAALVPYLSVQAKDYMGGFNQKQAQ